MIELISKNFKIRLLPRKMAFILFVMNALMFHAAIASAVNIVALQSLNIKPYDDAIKGFERACICSVERFVVSEMNDLDILKEIRVSRPDVILAIGTEALLHVSSIKNIPIIYLMVLNPPPVTIGRENITGISMLIVPERQLSVLKQALPNVKNVGLLFDPVKTGNFVNNARTAASEKNIKLIANEIIDSKDVPGALKSMVNKIDAFLMLPDTTVITPDTVEFLFLFTIENRIPVVTFSEKYLETGALISLDVDPYYQGEQAWSITNEILAGISPKKIKERGARDTHVTLNKKIAKKLGITIGGELLNNRKTLYKDEK